MCSGFACLTVSYILDYLDFKDQVNNAVLHALVLPEKFQVNDMKNPIARCSHVIQVTNKLKKP